MNRNRLVTSGLLTSGALSVASLATMASILGAGPVSAGTTLPERGQPPTIEVTSVASYEDQGWRVLAIGDVEGRPFDGTLYTTVKMPFGGWPAPGECVAGDASAYLDGPHRKEMTVVSSGEICGVYVQAPISLVSHVYTGRFDAYEATPANVEGTNGFMEVRLTNDGRAAVTLVES